MQTTLNVLGFLLIGMVVGAVFFALLHAEVTRLAHSATARAAVLMHLTRLVATSLVFWLVAHQGAAALIASLVGFTLTLATLRPLSTS